MSHRGWMLAAFIACGGLACKADREPKTKGTDHGSAAPSQPISSASDREALVSAAKITLGELVALESTADVTCWTSFRQLDWFIAEKSYSEFATLAKITAIKALVRAVWVKASADPKGFSPEAIAASYAGLGPIEIDPAKAAELGAFTNGIGLRNFNDYQKTAEQWRVVLSVITDEIHVGSGGDRLGLLSAPTLLALADAATVLSLHLSKRAGVAATEAKSSAIEAAHVKAAFASIAKDTGLSNKKRKAAPLDLKGISRLLLPLTKDLIEGKAKALLVFNRASGELATDLSRVSEIPVDEGAADVFFRRAKSFVHFATSGVDPMRADNYLSDGSFEKSRMARKPYLDHLQLQNVVQQTLPHRMLPNGDILVRFEPNPGPQTRQSFEPFEIRMLDHRMNGVRDSAVHWRALAEVFGDRPYAIDPFAAEYLSEVVSMLVTLQIERATRLAMKEKKSAIDADIAKRVNTKTYVMVPPDPNAGGAADWDKKWARKKAAALKPLGRALFTDVTAASGLPTALAKTEVAAGAGFNLQTVMGSGVAVGDVNSDGYPDVFINGEGLGRLLINKGASAPGTFADQTEAYKLPARLHDGHGGLFFDLEGDGDLDLIVLRSDTASAIYRQEDGVFVNASKSLGFSPGRGAHVAHIFDSDGDGDLDIYVGMYGSRKAHAKPTEPSLPSFDGRNGSPNQLWRNDGDKLTEVGAKAGLADIGWTLAVGSFDVDGDGDLDLYMANDFGANALFRNDGKGRFTDISAASGTNDRGSGMNVDVTDLNRDGRWDIYVTNIDMFSKRIKVVFPRDESTIDIDRELAESFQYLSGNKLYVSGPEGSLVASEVALIEPGDRGWGWDALFFDYENDGDDDLYLSNGWIEGSYAGGQKNQLFIFDEVFHLADDSSAEAVAGNTRSVAAADFDRDGDIDLILNQFRAPPVMLANRSAAKNRWLRLKLVGVGANPRAIGAVVRVTGNASDTVMRQVTAGRGYISQTETPLLVGVGKSATVDVEVSWPDGSKTTHAKLGTNRDHELKR